MTVVKDNSVKKLEKFTDEGIPAYKYLDNKIDYQIQELLKLKQQIQSVTAPDVPTKLSELSEDATHRVVTDTEKSTWNGKSNLALGETSVTAYRGDRGKEAYDAKHSHDNKTSVLDKFNNPTPVNGDIFQYNSTTEKYEKLNLTLDDLILKVIKAYNSDGIELKDESGNLGIKVHDGGNVSFGGDDSKYNSSVIGQHATNNTTAAFSSTYSDYRGQSIFQLVKSHSNTKGVYATTQNGERIGSINFSGVDSANDIRSMLTILVDQDGTAGSGSWKIPAKLQVFMSNGSSAITAMKLEKSGLATFIKLNLSGLPTSASGLSSGDVWNDGGILKIV